MESLMVSSTALIQYPSSLYSWTDRTGITSPDITGPVDLTTLEVGPTSTGSYRSLAVTADCTSPQSVGIIVVLWDDRGNPISVNSGIITLSSWAQNGLGNFIPSYGYGITPPGFVNIDVSCAAGYTILIGSFSIQNVTALGTVATTVGSPIVTGTTTGFTSDFVGKSVVFSADVLKKVYKIKSVTDSFHATLTNPVTFSESTGGTMTMVNPVNLHWKLF